MNAQFVNPGVGDFSVADVEADLDQVGDLGVEDIVFVPLGQSPNDQALVLTANEVSGTVTIFGTSGDITSLEPVENPLANLFRLSPNPTTGPVQIAYELPESSQVVIHLFDAMGRHIRNLVNSNLPAGPQQHEVFLDALPSGMYYLQARVNNDLISLPVVKQ